MTQRADNEFLTQPQLRRRYGVTRQDIRSEDFPQPMKILRRSYWRISDIEQWRRRPERGTVYIIGMFSYIKIGWTTDLERRMGEMRTFTPKPLRLLARFPGRKQDERALHIEFAAHRMNGEWFKRPPNLFDVIDLYAGATA